MGVLQDIIIRQRRSIIVLLFRSELDDIPWALSLQLHPRDHGLLGVVGAREGGIAQGASVLQNDALSDHQLPAATPQQTLPLLQSRG
jgi:hypothetical protein